MSGGSLTLNNRQNIGEGGTGILNISGTAIVTINGQFNVNSDQVAGGTGTVNQTGGTVTHSAGGWFAIGQDASGTGTYNLSGGTVTSAVTVAAGDNGTGILNISGTGLMNANGGLTLGANASSTSGTVNLDGGTLNATAVFKGAGSGAVFNFNGGLLQASVASTTFMTGLTTANVRNGGAKIDSQAFATTIGQALLHSTIGGDAATDGGLTKTGSATLTLSGANTYNGATAVNVGTLKAGVASVAGTSGAFGKNSAVTLANTAGVSMDITGFNTQIGSLAGGGATGGNVTLGAETLTLGADNTSTSYAGVISGTGGLTKTGTGTQTLTANSTFTGVVNVNQGALNIAGDLGTNAARTSTPFNVGSTTAATVNQTAGNVWVNGEVYVGNSTGAAVYNLSGGTLNSNSWVAVGRGDTAGGVRDGTLNISGNAVLNQAGTGFLTMGGFNSTASVGRVTVSNTATVNALQIYVSESGTGIFTMQNSAVANTALLRVGAGAGSSGTVNLDGGTVVPTQVASGGAGTSVFNFNGGTLKANTGANATFLTGLTTANVRNGGAVIDSNGQAITIGQVLQHSAIGGDAATDGGLTKNGNGTLTLSGTNTYTGTTAVNGGVLATDNLQANGTASGIGQGTALTLNGGTLRYTGGANSNGFNRAITVGASGGTLDNFGGAFVAYDGSLSGSGAATFLDSSSNGHQWLITGGSSGFSGNVFVGNGTAGSGAVQYRSSNANPFGTGTIQVNGGGIFAADNGATNPSTLGNNFVLNGGTLGTQQPNMTYTGTVSLLASSTVGHPYGGSVGTVRLSGVISGGSTAALIVSTATSVTLTGVNTYAGETDINAGTLIVSGSGKAGVGTVFVGNGTTTGTAAVLLADAGATIANTVSINPGNGTNRTIGGQNTSGMTTYSGLVKMDGISGENRSTNFTAATGGTVQYTNTISGAGQNATVTGGGTTVFSAANTYTGSTTVGTNGGTLTAGAAGALGGTSGITVNSGGTLLLAGAGAIDRVNNADFGLAGGTLSMVGLSSSSETLGALTLSANSTIDFGTGNTNSLTFASLSLGSFNLVVTHWTGTYYTAGETTDHSNGTQDRLLFTIDPSLNATQLSQISFYNDAGNFIGTGKEIAFGITELVPVPEPSTWIAGSLMLGLIGYRERRRLSAICMRRQHA